MQQLNRIINAHRTRHSSRVSYGVSYVSVWLYFSEPIISCFSATTVGVIVRLERESFQVLTNKRKVSKHKEYSVHAFSQSETTLQWLGTYTKNDLCKQRHVISIAHCKTMATPVHNQWSSHSLALNDLMRQTGWFLLLKLSVSFFCFFFNWNQ